MVIQTGKQYRCIRDVVMDTGEVAYIEGKIYKSEKPMCITDQFGHANHMWQDDRHYKPDDTDVEDYFEEI